MTGIFHKTVRLARICAAFAVSLTEVVVRRPATRRARAEWLTRFCRKVLQAVDITWSVSGPVPEFGAVISNHLTYVDILVHSAVRPCVFVSKAELRQTFLIGWISMMAGTVYVVRGAGGSAAKAAEGMAEGFHDGLPVTFFPEGSTFQGDEPVMPFRSGLLANAIAAGVPVQPAFLRYRLSDEDRADGRTERDDIHWGPTPMWPHIGNLLGLRGFHASVQFADEPVHFSPAAIADRKIAAEEARAAVFALSGQPAAV